MAVNDSDPYWNSYLPAFFDRMSMQMRKNMTAIVAPYGLTHAHVVYLIALHLQDGQTMVNLSRFLDLDTANTNRVIKVLREKGLVRDDRTDSSQKKFRIYLTEEGKKLAETVMNRITELNNSYFANIPDEDIINMRNTLVKVLANMNLDFEGYMNSRLDDPFYTHLHIVPVEGYEAVPLRYDGRRMRKEHDSE